MQGNGDVSLLELLELSDSERALFLFLARHGPADAAALTQSAGLDPADAPQALEALIEMGRVHRLDDGRVDAVAGRARRRAMLPAHLWNALQTTDRPFSEQEIATLRTAIPILQLARARMVQFADHGPGHALRVRSFAGQLAHLVGLSPVEEGLLRAAALFHDVGNIVDRGQHNVISQDLVTRLAAGGALPFTAKEAEIVGLVCRWHRNEYTPDRCDELNGQAIRTGLLASVLRVADAMDIDHRRSDYSERFSRVLRLVYPGHLPYWTSLEEILGVRVHCTPAVQLQALTRGQVRDNMQIAMLGEDLASTPFPWTLRTVAVSEGRAQDSSRREREVTHGRRAALLAFPFEPHSVVMAALSRKNLEAAGHGVALLCYPDTPRGSAWLWSQALPEMASAEFGRLVVIGDRPDPGVTSQLLEITRQWQAAGVAVSVLNRHEANWARLPALLRLGVEAVLGGDWAYFWGEPAGQLDLAWGRIAALCTRDPTQSTVGLTGEEQAITQGLLTTIYDAARRPADDAEGWAALAGPILDRIQADDRTYFAGQAEGFGSAYAAMDRPGTVEGRVLRFEAAPGPFPPSCYWALETAIEQHGRAPERGIRFRVPYAIATWGDADMVELLAISHWREEEATPIRLLYPADLGPPPAGNESTVQARLSAAQAPRIVRALVEACNGPDPAFVVQ